jgi:hypothetical protein
LAWLTEAILRSVIVGMIDYLLSLIQGAHVSGSTWQLAPAPNKSKQISLLSMGPLSIFSSFFNSLSISVQAFDKTFHLSKKGR